MPPAARPGAAAACGAAWAAPQAAPWCCMPGVCLHMLMLPAVSVTAAYMCPDTARAHIDFRPLDIGGKVNYLAAVSIIFGRDHDQVKQEFPSVFS